MKEEKDHTKKQTIDRVKIDIIIVNAQKKKKKVIISEDKDDMCILTKMEQKIYSNIYLKSHQNEEKNCQIKRIYQVSKNDSQNDQQFDKS